MKILITLLLALFISGQAYAQSSTEVIDKGKIISSHQNEREATYTVIYKKQLYLCNISARLVRCFKPNDVKVRTPE
tara:strand:- start:38 stop:265 length:228 start_codon:yes stop_codon:yes gene_type:complete